MRSRRIGLGALVFGLLACGSSAHAQDAGFSDPFFLYYGYFLPRQNAMAAQGQPEDFIRARAAQRSYTAATDRAGLYDAASSIGIEELDPLRPYGTRTGSTHMARTVATGLPSSVTRRGHSAPRSHYQNHGSYFPTIRSGSGGASRRAPAVSAGVDPSGAGRGRAFAPTPYGGMGPGFRGFQ